jgi:subtilisin family serine protease
MIVISRPPVRCGEDAGALLGSFRKTSGMTTRPTTWAAALSLIALTSICAPTTASAVPSSSDDTSQRRYIVTTTSGSSTDGAVADVRESGGRVDNVYSEIVDGLAATMSAAEARELATSDGVKSVIPDAVFRSTGVQTNPTWGLDRIDQRGTAGNGAYRYDSTGAGVTAFVIDTGTRLGHQQFGGRAVSGYDFVDDDTHASDCDGHGTHVSGTVAGSTYGAAKGAQVVAVRVLDCAGSGWASDIIDGLDWVAAHKPTGPAVVNMSLGGSAYGPIDDAVERVIAAGIPVVVAAGNSGENACNTSPARVPQAITVAATASDDFRPWWSNYGACVDLFAPGASVRSASNSSNSGTEVMSGTSMAAPHVAGIAARYLQSHTKATPSQVRTALVTAATTGKVHDPMGSPNRLSYVGLRPATVPGRPTNVAARKSDAARTGTIRWSKPTSSGGRVIRAYKVTRNGKDSRGVGPKTVVVSASTRSFTFHRLRAGSWYTLSVRAVNGVGSGTAVSKRILRDW